MAVTKTHPIKSTLKAAIAYICNPEKTDGNLLVSAYGCAAETADIEFAWTRRHSIDKGTTLGRHLIQAFEPGEVSTEEAHEIGMQLAKEILGGKYEFVLTTHIDKDHIHNHLIFNAVSFEDHKHYHSNKRSYHFIRRTSDRICKEHGLSVIIPGKDKGRSYIEHQAAQNGTSYKAKLKSTILKKHIDTYRKLKPTYDRYKAASDKEKFLRGFESEIILFEAAAREIKKAGLGKLPSSEKLKVEMDELTARKAALQAEHQKAQQEEKEYDTLRQNVDAMLERPQEREQQRQRSNDLE